MSEPLNLSIEPGVLVAEDIVRRQKRRRAIVEYLTLGVINSATVYALYTPYVFLWVRLDWAQYVRWLEGGIAYSLATGWLIALVIVRARRAFFGEHS